MKKSDKPENTRMMTVYAVIDTNVIVSALYSKKPDTAPLLILENLFDGNIVPMYNAEILAEYNEVLHRPKFPFSDKDIRLVLETGWSLQGKCSKFSACRYNRQYVTAAVP